MALSLEDRVRELAQDRAYRLSVVGALSKQAKYFLRTPKPGGGEWDTGWLELARGVITAPDAYAYRFGIAVLTEPAYDAINDVSEIPDATPRDGNGDPIGMQGIQDTVAELWGLFAPEVEA